MPHEIDQIIAGECYTSTEAMDNLTVLCDEFGSRFAGTAGEKQAADFIQAKLAEYGLTNIQVEEVEYTGWFRGTAHLEIVAPFQQTIPCISLPHSPPADLTADLYDADDGHPDLFATDGDNMRGKIVLADSQIYPSGMKRWVHRSEKYGRSMLNGAAAFIFKNHYPAYGPATGSIGHNGGAAFMPGIAVSYEDGAFLQRMAKKHGKITLKLKTTDELRSMTSWNITGDIAGSGDDILMLGSHYDGHDIAQGAQDPASGVVSVLEVARILAKHGGQPESTIRFALWGVEEIGLLGSYEYANRHESELSRFRFYFNMDGAGSVVNKGVTINEWPELESMIQGWQSDIAFSFKTQQSMNAHSDHYPFLLKGVPTGGLESVPKTASGRGYGHTAYDTLDKVTTRELQDAAFLASSLIHRLANVPAADWPVTHRTAEQVAAMLALPDYADVAQFEKDIDAFYEKQN